MPYHDRSTSSPNPNDAMSTRTSDHQIKVTREIPLPWLLGLVGAILLFAATVYFTQQRMIEVQEELKTQVKALTTEFMLRNERDQRREFDVEDLKRRVSALEGAKK